MMASSTYSSSPPPRIIIDYNNQQQQSASTSSISTITTSAPPTANILLQQSSVPKVHTQIYRVPSHFVYSVCFVIFNVGNMMHSKIIKFFLIFFYTKKCIEFSLLHLFEIGEKKKNIIKLFLTFLIDYDIFISMKKE